MEEIGNENLEKVSGGKINIHQGVEVTCSKCGSRRVQQKSEEKVRCLDCGYVERFHIKHSYVLVDDDKTEKK